MDKTNDVTTSISGSSESRATTVSDTRRRPFFLCNAAGSAAWATTAILVRYMLGESLDVVERWRVRVGALMVTLLNPAFAVHDSYKTVTHSATLKQVAERLSNERKRGKKKARKLVQASVVVVLALSLVCMATLVYFGEWPQVWEFLEIPSSFLDLLA
jgi:hypothetical protein